MLPSCVAWEPTTVIHGASAERKLRKVSEWGVEFNGQTGHRESFLGRDTTEERPGEGVEVGVGLEGCVPRYIRRLAKVQGDTRRCCWGCRLRLPPTKPSEGIIKSVYHVFNSWVWQPTVLTLSILKIWESQCPQLAGILFQKWFCVVPLTIPFSSTWQYFLIGAPPRTDSSFN